MWILGTSLLIQSAVCLASTENCDVDAPSDQSSLLQVSSPTQASSEIQTGIDEEPCTRKSQCKTVYREGFRQGGFKLITWEDHGHDIYCGRDNHEDAIQWNRRNRSVTISYLGQQNGLVSTCYITTPNFCDMGICDVNSAYRQLTDSGYVSADIQIQADSPDLRESSIWPGFALVGDPHEYNWPKGGEVEIAEKIHGVTESWLIGKSDYSDADLIAEYPRSALQPGGETHNYGLEWRFRDGQTGLDKLELSIYFDHKKIGGSYTCHYSDRQDRPCQQIFKGMKSGQMVILLTANTHDRRFRSDNLYSMVVSNLMVQEVQQRS